MAPDKGLFKTEFSTSPVASSPESLFHDLRGRAPEIKHLWSHQADLLRTYYQEHTKTQDIAVELPTGAGKTLVGLLIGEWRRQANSERVVYLCPTRQLARQVGRQAQKYCIPAHVFVGSQKDYPAREFNEYEHSQAIAITTYNGVFNIKPRLNDAQTLILDDAHAGENFISNMWSVVISRNNCEDIYRSLLNVFIDEIDRGTFNDLTNDTEWSPEFSGILEMLPAFSVRKYLSTIDDILDNHLDRESSAWYAWIKIKDHLKACNIFISRNSILIRPYIPPTMTHSPFSQAKQRLYMSATLGAGGELERVTGIRSIKRLPLPTGWEKRGSGRRLFLVPELSLSKQETLDVVKQAMEELDRSLILVPSLFDTEDIGLQNAVRSWPVQVMNAGTIEDSIEPFVQSHNSTLILSRYDGLDLPDDVCRLLIFGGLPTGTNLQERFLWSRIAASSLLRDRVVTRFTQGVGRCTRSDNDYAVIILMGNRLIEFLLRRENNSLLNSELQAEIKFGFENSREKSKDDFSLLWNAFLKQSKEWAGAENAILSLRDGCTKSADPISGQLNSVVKNEVDYLYALWTGNFEEAFEQSRIVADALSGDDTKAYRAWWYYLSSEAALILYSDTQDETYIRTARDLLSRASKCCLGVSWLAKLGRSLKGGEASTPTQDEPFAIALENIRSYLSKVGTIGNKFERNLAQIFNDLQASEHTKFHNGLRGLGEILGFLPELPAGQATPDCIWSIGNHIYITHEAKSEHSPEDAIGVNDVRQAQSHANWISAEKDCHENTLILNLIESPREKIHIEAIPHGKELYYCPPGELVKIFEESTSLLRRIRSRMPDLSEEKILEEIAYEMDRFSLTPEKLIERLKDRKVSDLDKVST